MTRRTDRGASRLGPQQRVPLLLALLLCFLLSPATPQLAAAESGELPPEAGAERIRCRTEDGASGPAAFLNQLVRTGPEYHNRHKGPLLVQGHSLLQLLRLNMLPWATPALEKGQLELQTTATWVNLWAWKPSGYLVDGEVLRLSFAACYGLLERVQLRLEVPVLYQTGGIMDTFIQGFHDTFGYTQAHRDSFPKNRLRVAFYPRGGGEFRIDDDDAGFFLSDLTLTLRTDLYPGSFYLPAVTVAQVLKVPTGQHEGGGVDGGVTLYLAKRVWKVYGYFGVQYTRYGQEKILGVAMEPDQWSLLFCLELPLSDRLSLLVQELSNTGVARDFYDFSQSTHELTVGTKIRLSRQMLLELGAIENLFHYNNSPDFGFHCGLSYCLD
ncbi:MAG: DUF3187 family protein [bacterium]